MQPTFTPRYGDDVVSAAQQTEDRNCREFALAVPWQVPSKIQDERQLPFEAVRMFTLLGFTPSLRGNVWLVREPEGWTKETEGLWGKIKDPAGVEMICLFYKPGERSFSYFTDAAIERVRQAYAAIPRWKKWLGIA